MINIRIRTKQLKKWTSHFYLDMVRGLTVGILHNNSQEKVETTIDQLPRSSERESPRVIIDGVSLAYHVLTPEDKEHSWEFVNGGDYRLYRQKVTEFFQLLKSFAVDVAIVFPLSDGTPPITEVSTSRWNQKELEKVRRACRIRTLLEKGMSTSRSLQEILPPFIIQEIAETSKENAVEVIYTRNNVTRYASKYVAEKKADAVIGQNSDYLIFDQVNYIPLDSIIKNDKDELQFDLLNNVIAARIINLEKLDKMMELGILLGNPFTEPFVVSKYNMPNTLHIKLNPKYPASLVNGIVAHLNNPEFESIEATSPTKEIIDGDAEFQKAIEDSKAFFDIKAPLDPEGDSDIVKETLAGNLPLWAPAIFENGDFWYDPLIDDYKHQVQTPIITQPIRKFFYTILKREGPVIEHLPGFETVETSEVTGEAGFPSYEKLWPMAADKKKVKKLQATFANLTNCLFPVDYKGFPAKDPLDKIGEPYITIGYSLRYLISLCFTQHQTQFSLLPENGPESLKSVGVIGAPPIDLYELKSILGMILILNMNLASKVYVPPSQCKPKLRRSKVAAYYQSVLQHIIWLEQLLKIFDQDKCKPNRLYNGEIFALIYEFTGDMTNPKFQAHFDDSIAEDKVVEKLQDIATKRLPQLLDAVLAPFPSDLFDAFAGAPRSISTTVYDDAKPVQQEVITVKSKFAALADDDYDDDEDLDDEPVSTPAPAPAPAPVVAAPPPPPPKKQQKKKPAKEEDDDEDMEAFLMAQAAKNASQGGAPKPKVSAPKPAPKKKPHVRKLEGGMTANNPVFNKESKQEYKRQLKQQGFDYN